MGGIITILSRIGILAFFLFLAKDVFERNSVVTSKSVYKSANDNNQTYDLSLDNFDLAVGITFYDGLSHEYEKANLKKYATIEFTYYRFG